MDKKKYNEIDDGFEIVIGYRTNIKKIIEAVEQIKIRIKKNYIECIGRETNNYFGLDSVYFQNKLVELEYKKILEIDNYIKGHIYGDYYKLFSKMKDYLHDKLSTTQYNNIEELDKLKKYPVFKDLEYNLYEFDTINNIHRDVINVIKKVNEVHLENSIIIRTTQKAAYKGANLENYIINQHHINKEMMLTNELHATYINMHHKFHKSILNNFLERIELFYGQINQNLYVGDASNL